MKKTILSIILVLSVISILAVQQTANSRKFEYLDVYVQVTLGGKYKIWTASEFHAVDDKAKYKTIGDALSALGDQGWEVKERFGEPIPGTNTMQDVYLLMREK